MCISDWRLGRQIRTQITAFSLTTAQVQQLAANPQRVGVTFGLTVPTTGALAAAVVRIGGIEHRSLSTENPSYHITLATHGELPTLACAVVSKAGTMTGSIIEYFLPEEVIQAGLDEFKRAFPNLFR